MFGYITYNIIISYAVISNIKNGFYPVFFYCQVLKKKLREQKVQDQSKEEIVLSPLLTLNFLYKISFIFISRTNVCEIRVNERNNILDSR